MQTNVITSPLHVDTKIQNYNPKAKSNETLNQVSTVSNTQEGHTKHKPSSSSSDTQRSLLCSVREFFSPSSSASKNEVTFDELKYIEEGKSLVLERDSLMQKNQRNSNLAFSNAPSCGWKTVFGLGVLAGASVSCGAFLWARHQNNLIPANSCPPIDNAPLSPYSMPLPSVTQSITEAMQFRPDMDQPSKKSAPLTSIMSTIKPIQSMRKNPRGDFFKQTKVCDNSRTDYKDCHVRYIEADNYQRYCFLYSEAKPCERPEDVNKPVVRVVEPQKNIDTGKLNIKQKMKNTQLDSCTYKKSLCIPYPLEAAPDTYIQKCYDYETTNSCLIKLKDYETE